MNQVNDAKIIAIFYTIRYFDLLNYNGIPLLDVPENREGK